MCNQCNNNCNNLCNPQTNPCGCGTSTDQVVYSGPNLTCTGVKTCDTLTSAILNIGQFMCSLELVQIVINNITNNISLYNQFTTIVNNTVDCQTVWNCIESNTTTTTTSTIPLYDCYTFLVKVKIEDLLASDDNSVSVVIPTSCEGTINKKIIFNKEGSYSICVRDTSLPPFQLISVNSVDVPTKDQPINLNIFCN